MPNMNPKKCPMPEQAPDVRNKNFEEVTLGYTAEMAVEEAQRCLNCKNKPCMTGCPVQVKIPEFIALVAEGKFLEAAAKIKETSALPAVCGRVCPQESQCECHCVRGIKGEAVAIGRLERFVADYARENSSEKAVKPESNGHKVAIVGAGPAGLTCAGDLARMGYEVTVFEEAIGFTGIFIRVTQYSSWHTCSCVLRCPCIHGACEVVSTGVHSFIIQTVYVVEFVPPCTAKLEGKVKVLIGTAE